MPTDLRFAFRQLRSAPAFSPLVVLMLALGIPARRATRVDPASALRAE